MCSGGNKTVFLLYVHILDDTSCFPDMCITARTAAEVVLHNELVLLQVFRLREEKRQEQLKSAADKRQSFQQKVCDRALQVEQPHPGVCGMHMQITVPCPKCRHVLLYLASQVAKDIVPCHEHWASTTAGKTEARYWAGQKRQELC